MDTKEQIMQFIKNYIKEKRYCPSIREIAQGVGLKTPSTVHKHIHKLKEEGKINFIENVPRTIVVKEE
jgi:repressor LexA